MNAVRVALAFAWLLVALAQPGDAAERVVRLGGVEAVVWSPPAEAAKPWPVVVFSHGIRLCATQSRFLTEALSASGYLVVAPNHDDAKCGELDLSPPSTNQLGMKPASMWSDDDFRNRGDDVRKVVEALRTDAELATSVDLARLALVGHSLGGYTVLGLAGAWPSWRLAGVKAVLALSPYTQPFRRSEGLRKVGAPLMLQGGTLDLVFTPPLRGKGGAYGRAPKPKYYVEIDGAAHFAWTDSRATGKDAILAYAIAFLDRHVKGLPADPVLQGLAPGAAAYLRDPPVR